MSQKNIFTLFIFILSLTILTLVGGETQKANLSTLQLVQVVYRHGDRTPLSSYPNDPYGDISTYWPMGLGQLTEVGKDQQYDLGRFFRRRFGGFLSDIYSPPEIHVISSDTDRTLVSAEANLAGLYPQINAGPFSGRLTASGVSGVNLMTKLKLQLVPIHTRTADRDEILHLTAPCPRRTQARNEFYAASPLYNEILKENREFLDFVTEKSGSRATEMFQLVRVHDTLFVQTVHNFTLPEWANSTVMERLVKIRSMGFLLSSGTTELRRLQGGPLVKRLLNNMKKHIQKEGMDETDRRKMFMHSAHDDTLAAVMTTMGVFDIQIPPYASTFILELHEEPETGKYFVEMFYRNTTKKAPFALHIPGCSTRGISGVDRCYLDDMEKLLQPVIPHHWEEECRITQTPHKNLLSSSGEYTPTIVIYRPGIVTMMCFLAICLSVGVAVLVLSNQKWTKSKRLYTEIA